MGPTHLPPQYPHFLKTFCTQSKELVESLNSLQYPTQTHPPPQHFHLTHWSNNKQYLRPGGQQHCNRRANHGFQKLKPYTLTKVSIQNHKISQTYPSIRRPLLLFLPSKLHSKLQIAQTDQSPTFHVSIPDFKSLINMSNQWLLSWKACAKCCKVDVLDRVSLLKFSLSKKMYWLQFHVVWYFRSQKKQHNSGNIYAYKK